MQSVVALRNLQPCCWWGMFCTSGLNRIVPSEPLAAGVAVATMQRAMALLCDASCHAGALDNHWSGWGAAMRAVCPAQRHHFESNAASDPTDMRFVS